MLYFSVKYYLYREQLRVVFHFYKNLSFVFFDFMFFIAYLFSNPYRICRKYHERRGEEKTNVYGETPLTTLMKICHLCGIHSTDTIIELGSGRGRSCFFLASVIGAKVTGIEKISQFTNRAILIQKALRFKNLKFNCSDFYDIDFSKVNVVYLYAPQLEDQNILKLSEKLKALPKGAKIITISYSMHQYSPKSFQSIKRFSVSFPWGKTHAFLCTKA